MFQLKKQGTLITSGLHILSVKISPVYTTKLRTFQFQYGAIISQIHLNYLLLFLLRSYFIFNELLKRSFIRIKDIQIYSRFSFIV
jgi:hypothetical protein